MTRADIKYVSFPKLEKEQPPRHLRGFHKVALKPGETNVVSFPLVSYCHALGADKQRKKDLAVWDVERQLWHIPAGKFTFAVGNSSRNLVLEAEVEIGK